MEETAKVPGQHKIHFRTLILSDLHLGARDSLLTHVHGSGEIAGWSLGTAGGDDFPEERVVPMTATVVTDSCLNVIRK